jgi:putative ABC transport system permease protein
VLAIARRTADSIARSLNAQHALELDSAVNPNSNAPAGAPPYASSAILVRPLTEKGHYGFSFVTMPFVATPAVLNFYRIPATSADIVTVRGDLSGIRLSPGTQFSSAKREPLQSVTIQVTKLLPKYTSPPNTLITEGAMSAFGLTSQPVGWLMQTRHPLTAAQVADARRRAAQAGITIETRTGGDNSQRALRTYSTIIGVLVALGVLAMTVGLIRSETAGDRRTLTATGASGRTRRTLNAATAERWGCSPGRSAQPGRIWR